MADTKIDSCLTSWHLRLSQSVNIEFLGLVDGYGEVYASAGDFGVIDRNDAEDLLRSYFNNPENMVLPDVVDHIHIIKKGAVECFVAPINTTIQLLAIASIERPSVLIRVMMKEIMAARDDIGGIIQREWQVSGLPEKLKSKTAVPEAEEHPAGAGHMQEKDLEQIINNPRGGKIEKDAKKYWDSAFLDEEQSQGSEKAISFNDAKRSGLIEADGK